MKPTSIIAAMVSMAFMFSSCDAVKSFFGMPTSKDIEKMQIEEQMRLDKIKRYNDSIAAARADSIKAVQAAELKKAQSRYMVIVGSFKEVQNAPNMMKMLESKGYKPETIKFKNGFDVVSAYSSRDYRDALSAMQEIMETPFCPEDIWIYDRQSGNHVE